MQCQVGLSIHTFIHLAISKDSRNGAEQAAKTLTSIKTAKMSNLSDEKRDEIFNEIKSSYDKLI